MAGLNHTLNISGDSLMANRQGMDTTAHNIANAQTEGYSRQEAKLYQREPILTNGMVIGDGVFVGTIQRSHDKFIEKQLNNAATKNGMSDKLYEHLQDLQLIFSPELESTIAEEMSSFFSSIQTLSNIPDDLTARTALVDQAHNLSTAFKRVDTEVKQKRAALNDVLAARIREANDITDQLARLNVSIQAMEVTPSASANDLKDQQNRLLTKLSGIVDISYYQDRDGMLCVRGPGETLLVDRKNAAKLDVMIDKDNDGMLKVINIEPESNQIWDLTDKVRGGEVKAILHVRDMVAKPILSHSNELATTFVNEVNQIHGKGFGLNQFAQSTGRGFFEPITDLENAAANVNVSKLIESSTDAISIASSPDARGDNIIANELLGINRRKILENGNATLNDYYANFVGTLGTEAVRAQHHRDTDKLMLSELRGRKEMVAGVSLDEEAANMIKWQTAFTASSKLITTVDEMFETILGMKR